MLKFNFCLLTTLIFSAVFAQNTYELNNGWKCASIKQIQFSGDKISQPSFNLDSWQPAVVPGTVLTTMLANKQIQDPFYGMNNNLIPDIYNVGKAYYTYWFVNDFKEKKLGTMIRFGCILGVLIMVAMCF